MTITSKRATKRIHSFYALAMTFVLLLGFGRVCLKGNAMQVSSDYINGLQLKNSVLVIPADAKPVETYAAKELSKLLFACTGKLPPIVTKISDDVSGKSLPVYIGSAVQIDDIPSGCEDILIDIRQSGIHLTGGGERGILYAALEFAQRYLGVRFLTSEHTYVPTVPPERIPIERFSYSPPFEFRWSYYYANSENHQFAAKMRNNTISDDASLGGSTAQILLNHSFTGQLPVSKYGKDNPEYFAMVGGKRTVDRWDAQPCYSNPDVVRIIADEVIRYFDQNPEAITVSVSANDNDYYCRCPECQKLNDQEGGPSGSHLKFINTIAEQVEQHHPDKMIGTLAYWHTQKPPKTIRPRDNVQIQLAIIQGCAVHGYHAPPCAENQFMGSLVKDWGKITDNLYIWDYYTNFGAYDLPFPNIRSISDRVRWYQKWGARGVFMQANYQSEGGDYSDLRNYVISRLLWDPTLDSWELAEEFCRLHYGDAAPYVLKHLKMIHEDAEQRDLHPGYYSTPEALGINQKSALKGLAIFNRAKTAAESADILKRVRKASICVYRAFIESRSMIYEDGIYRLDMPNGLRWVIDDYLALTRIFNITHANEYAQSDKYNQELLRALEGFEALQFENDTWAVILLPGESGQIVQLFHKPSGRDLLRKRWIYWHLDNYIGYSWSNVQEKLVKGFNNWNGRFESEKNDTGIVLSVSGSDGSKLTRTLNFINEQILFHTVLTHKGCVPGTYSLSVIPEFGTGINTNCWGGGDSDMLGGYVYGDGRWIQFNKGWHRDHGPDLSLLKEATEGKIAFYNHDSNFGVAVSYDTTSVDHPRFFWYPLMGCVNIELHTGSVLLQPDESFELSYGFDYIAGIPPLQYSEKRNKQQ